LKNTTDFVFDGMLCDHNGVVLNGTDFEAWWSFTVVFPQRAHHSGDAIVLRL